jgi:RecA/RadA recombinase
MQKNKQTAENETPVEATLTAGDGGNGGSSARNERLKALAAVSKRFKAFRPARDVLLKVEAVPTIFPWYDMGTRVGGHPLARFGIVHGPSNHGKTAFVLGLGLSFLNRDHFFGLIDAENTTPIDWVEKLMGPNADHPGFSAIRPTSYEETVDATREYLVGIGEAREKGQIPKDTTALVVVDSIRKLVPQNIWDKIQDIGAEGEKGSVDGMGGRAAQIKAAMNAAWLDEVTMLLQQTNTAMVVIARESQDVNADANKRKYGQDFKITGGGALVFDSSLGIRVTRKEWTRVGASKTDGGTVVGEQHQVRIWKTKIGGKDDKHTDTYFHTSNGVQTPEGFDRARDVLELGMELAVVKSPGGAWLSWSTPGKRWNGKAAALKALAGDPEMLGALEREVRGQFGAKPEAAE